MKIDKEKIQLQLQLLEQEIENLRQKQHITLDEYLSNKEIQYFVERAFHKAIESCINIGNYLLSKLALGLAEEFGTIFIKLQEANIISSGLSKRLIKMCKFRNLLVHMYWQINTSQVYSYLQNNLTDLSEFSESINTYLEKLN